MLTKISDVIKILEKAKEKHGDIPIALYDPFGIARENVEVYFGNISTELRAIGAEVEW